MAANKRLNQIEDIVNQRGFISVRELCEIHDVSEMTIRRDLQQLEAQGRLKRTFGGAASLRLSGKPQNTNGPNALSPTLNNVLTNRVDAIIATSLEKHIDRLLLDQANKKDLPVVAESAPLEKEVTLVALDNYEAAYALGRFAGAEATRRWNGRVNILDLTYRMPNTRLRSQAFVKAVQETCPTAELTLSIDAQSSSQSSYQITKDALAVHPQINLIFAINDSTAAGALRACRELAIDPDSLTIVPFGLEGDTMRDALAEGRYCRFGLAMFPEIVAPTCIEAAIIAFNRQPLPPHLVTPFAILTSENLSEIYRRNPHDWEIAWETVYARYTLPLELQPAKERFGGMLPHGMLPHGMLPHGMLPHGMLPQRIGFIIPFHEHEWYHNLVRFMRLHAQRYGIDLEVVDTEKDMYDEVENRRRAIALLASDQVQPRDVLIIDEGPIASYLARNLIGKVELTVITNAMNVFNILSQDPDITLISTGGVLRRSSQVLVGSTAEGSLRDLRVDRLFLSVSGVSLDFGLSHSNYSEVSIKQAMIRSAREVVLLADFTNFGQEAIAQVESLQCVHCVITDDSLPATIRLELSKLGIRLLLAST